MLALLSPEFVLEEVTQDDLAIASIAWGFTIGFGWLTTWTAIKQTTKIWRRYGTQSIHNTYVWLMWLEIIVCSIYSIMCWLYLKGTIPPSFTFYFIILTTWALQVQFLLQIIINRCALLIPDRKHVRRLKLLVAVLITAVNISVYNIWIPARLQTSESYIAINDWWDRCEKVIYLLVDGMLNTYFILIVKRNLISYGLTKYKRLTNFNIILICFSLSMDVLIISMMSIHNTFVYMQFHPLAYMVKLKIEMSMADLIAKVARKQERLPTFHKSISQGRRMTLNSPLRSLTRNTSQVQPLPPARNAVPFRVWSASNTASLKSAVSNHGGPLQDMQEELSMGGSEISVCDVSGSSLYMVQEVTVEVVDRDDASLQPQIGHLPEPNFINRLADNLTEEGGVLTLPVIWDGSGSNSTVIGTGRRLDAG